MAMKPIDWTKVEIKPPSWDGPMSACPGCGGKNAYSVGGTDRSGKFCYTSWCFDCKWHESENWADRDVGQKKK